MILDEIETLSDEELFALRDDVLKEVSRRASLANAKQAVERANLDYLEASGVVPGGLWRQPTGYHDSYPLGWEVEHNGKAWISLRAGASGEPGVVTEDWKEKQEPGQIVDWVQPHAGSEYPVGALVRHENRIWRNDHSGPNGWEPGTTGAQWTDVTDEYPGEV